MSTSSRIGSPQPRAATRVDNALAADGRAWLTYAGIVLMIMGVLNVIYGIAAIDRSSFYVSDANYVISDLRTWGWVALVLGVAQFLSAFAIWNGGPVGRWFGVTCASLNAIAQLLAIPGSPFLALTLFGVDVLVIYALVTHGGRGPR
jgi:hypothetical protein